MTPHAIERAWLLARAHGHHWAASATPRNLALGRAILARGYEFHLDAWSHVSTLQPLYDSVAHIPDDESEAADLVQLADRTISADPPLTWYERRDAHIRELAATARLSVRAILLSGASDTISPQTAEECEALSALPTGQCGGVGWSVDADGAHRHCTGTGRTEWTVYPDGGTSLRAYRPGGVLVLSAWIPPRFSGELAVRYDDLYSVRKRVPSAASRKDGPSIIVHSADWASRHWHALPFQALGCSADHLPTEAEFADETADLA